MTLSLHLSSIGCPAIIVERQTELREVGAGIQLSPNATRLLYEVGLGEELAKHAVCPSHISIRLAQSGREIATIPLGQAIIDRYGSPYMVIHRGDLQSVLLKAVKANRDIKLHFDAPVIDILTGNDGALIVSERNGQPADYSGAGLVGADGVWSTVRRKGVGGPEPVYSGRTAWRATISADDVPKGIDALATNLWLGAGAHLVHYPIAAGRKINIVAIVTETGWHEQGWSVEGDPKWLADRFADWAPIARQLLDRPDKWLKWALCGVDPDFNWTKGPITLLGDSAHAMLPFVAQGGAMAIEDAAVLADCVAGGDLVPTAFRKYESLRKPRVSRVSRTAAENGRTYHLSGPTALARNMVLASLPAQSLLARFDWLYGWTR
ncbi:MAG: FAD-dependent monooxygenase [Hyphomicrobiales bacterium]|nr:FAD-dependent monooxygenase [Hyphomicrobiales bacterium]